MTTRPVETALKVIFLEVEASLSGLKLPRHSIGSIRRILTDLADNYWRAGYAAALDHFGIITDVPQSPYYVPPEAKNDERGILFDE